MTAASTLLHWTGKHLGFTEGPRENQQPFTRLAQGVDRRQPWCADFLCAGARATGLALPAGAMSSYTPTMRNAFVRAGRLFGAPRVGDFGFVYYDSLSRTGHVFVVEQVLPGHRVRTHEGNTNQAASRTGGQVASLVRDYAALATGVLDQDGEGAVVTGFGRPYYDDEPLTGPGVVSAAPVRAQLGALVVDGALGPATIRRWQAVMGTPVDGVISRPSALVRAVQAATGMPVGDRDGVLGPQTVRALQRHLGVEADGKLGPVTVRTLQSRLNLGRF